MIHSKSKIQNPKFSFLRYECYKASGIEWVGTIPSHWDVKPGRVTLALNKEKNAGNIEETVLSLSYGRLVIKPPEKMTGLVPESLEGYQIINPGDIIIRPTDLQNDWTSLRVGLAKNRGIITSAYLGLKHDEKISSEYLYYLLHSYDLLKVYYGMGTGLRQNLSWDDFKYLPLTLPPKPEQDRIVAFLDQKTAEIDALITKKQRQIELLDEQKAILINRAVTRGLNPNAKLKPSGSKWIGQIPTHWETGRLKHHCIKIVDCPHATPIYDPDGEHPAIRTADVTPGHIDLNGAKRLSKAEFSRWTERMVPRFGDILYSREGERFGIAAPLPPDSDLCISQRMMAFRPSQDVSSQFLMWQLNCRHVYLQACQDVTGSAAPHVNIGTIANYQLVLPPLVEQEEIATFISDSDRKSRSIISKIESQIESLKTLRSTLIAHAVTGRIKV